MGYNDDVGSPCSRDGEMASTPSPHPNKIGGNMPDYLVLDELQHISSLLKDILETLKNKPDPVSIPVQPKKYESGTGEMITWESCETMTGDIEP